MQNPLNIPNVRRMESILNIPNFPRMRNPLHMPNFLRMKNPLNIPMIRPNSGALKRKRDEEEGPVRVTRRRTSETPVEAGTCLSSNGYNEMTSIVTAADKYWLDAFSYLDAMEEENYCVTMNNYLRQLETNLGNSPSEFNSSAPPLLYNEEDDVKLFPAPVSNTFLQEFEKELQVFRSCNEDEDQSAEVLEGSLE